MNATQQHTIENDTTLGLPRPFWLACCIIALCIVAYLNSYWGAFVYDDGLCLIDRGIDEWWPEKFSTGKRRWLTHLTFVANYRTHAYWAPGFHVVNNLIHAVAGLCLFGLVRRTLLLPATRERFAKSASWLAFAVAAVWLVHPLQTESVTYIVQRLESLAGMFFFLSLYLVLRGSQSRFAIAWYAGAVLAVWIGTGAKETMFLAPIAILLYDRTYLASSWRDVWKSRGAVHIAILLSLVWSGYWLTLCFSTEQSTSLGFAFKGVTPWEYLRSQPEVILHYLRLSFWPAQQCLDYGWRVQNDPRVYFGLGAIVLTMVILSLALCWYRPRIGFVAFMFFFILAPTSSFMPIRDLAFEHRMYLPLACVVLLVVLGVHHVCQMRLQERVPRLGIQICLLLLVVTGLTLRTRERNRLYHDPVDVWREVTQRSPWHTRATYNLGLMLLQRGLVPGGEAEYKRLLLSNPKELHGIGNHIRDVKIEGDVAEAANWFQRTLVLDPKDSSTHFNLAGIYDRAGDVELAISHHREALKYKRKHIPARLQLTKLLQKQGEFQEATEHALTCIELAPKDPRAYTSFGKLLAAQGKHEEAIEQFRKALEFKSDHHSASYQMTLSLWKLDRQREAISLLRDTRRRNRNLSDVNLELARFVAMAKDEDLRNPAEAAALAQEVLKAGNTRPAPTYGVLAIAQMELQRFDLAAASIERGLSQADPQRDAQVIAELHALRERMQQHVSVSDAPAAPASDE